MSRGTFCCIVITAGGDTALMSKINLEKIFIRLEKHSQVVSAWESQKRFFGVKSAFSFLRLSDELFFYNLEISTS